MFRVEVATISKKKRFKIGFISVGTLGDVLPLVDLACLLQSNGHVPIIFTTCNWQPVCVDAGVSYMDIGSFCISGVNVSHC